MVASKSAFSNNGCVVNAYRSKLNLKGSVFFIVISFVLFSYIEKLSKRYNIEI